MSLTLNMVGGGGDSLKATDALLRVQAPAGSTVTITKGTTTKTDLGHENADDHTIYDYYFIIHQSQFDSVNAWTVTATLTGEDPVTKTVIIDSADEYDVIINYTAWLYNEGNQYTHRTGGWEATTGSQYVTFGATSIQFSQRSVGVAAVVINQAIDLSRYTTLKADIVVNRYGGSSGNTRLGIANSHNITADNQFAAYSINYSTGTITMSLDITNYNDAKYIVITDYVGTTDILRVWLE